MEIYESQMLSIFNKKGKNIAILRTDIIFTLIVVYFVYSDFAPIKLIQGPTQLENINVVDYKNQYVIVEKDLLLGAYMDTFSTDEKLMGVSIRQSDIEMFSKSF